jgi:heat shock protein HslJ
MRSSTAVLIAATILAGCSSVQRNADVPSLDGTAWVLSELPGATLPPGQPATVQFQGGKAAGSDGCNRYSAPYTASGGSITISQGATTMMACPPPQMELARAFSGALTGAKRYRMADGRLQLLGGDGAVLATFARQSQELAGTSWRATGINNGKGGVASLVQGSEVTLAFGADGRVAGSAGCNNFTGGYTAEGTSVRFGPAATTRKMCAGEGVMEQEAAFLTALGTVASAEQEGDRLRLRTEDGATAVVLVRDTGT